MFLIIIEYSNIFENALLRLFTELVYINLLSQIFNKF